MKTIILKINIISMLLLFISSSVNATCWYDGREYPTGTRIGTKVCQYDGYWR
ncbi:MAG: hypothetical protein ACI8ZB_004953 [Desulforhopalus sp.]|jgi:hypothetical protein